MATFQLLFLKIAPLFALILLGYFAAKKLAVDKNSIGRLLLYIVSPIIVFYGGLFNDFTLANLSLPIIVFIIASLVSVIFYLIGKKVFPDNTDANLLAYAAGASNSGYFGLPVIAAVLGTEAFTLAIIANLGMILYENTTGFYLAAKGNYSVRQSLIKIARLPHLYALIVGISLHYFGFSNNEIFRTNYEYFKGAYTLLGMMIIGMGLAEIKFQLSDFKFMGWSFLAKFVCLPIITYLYVLSDRAVGINTELAHQILLIIACTPLAANTVVIASELKLNPAKAALAVLASTVFALCYIPLLVTLFF